MELDTDIMLCSNPGFQCDLSTTIYTYLGKQELHWTSGNKPKPIANHKPTLLAISLNFKCKYTKSKISYIAEFKCKYTQSKRGIYAIKLASLLVSLKFNET